MQFSTRLTNLLEGEFEYLGVSDLDDLKRHLQTDETFPRRLLRVPGLGRKSADELYSWANDGRTLFGPKPDLRRKKRQQVVAKKADELRGVIARAEARLKAWRDELKDLERELD
jgi:hypothetical protein